MWHLLLLELYYILYVRSIRHSMFNMFNVFEIDVRYFISANRVLLVCLGAV